MNKILEKIIKFKYEKDTKQDKENEKAFISFLDITYRLLVIAFIIFSIISFSLFVKHEVLQ